MDEKPIVIRTYKRIWKFPRILYKIDRFKLLRPVTYWQILYFFIGIILAAILNQFFFFSWIPSIVKFLIFPIGLSIYLSKAKHDGKAPHRWLLTYIRYLAMPKVYNRYKPVYVKRREKHTGVATFRELYELDAGES